MEGQVWQVPKGIACLLEGRLRKGEALLRVYSFRLKGWVRGVAC